MALSLKRHKSNVLELHIDPMDFFPEYNLCPYEAPPRRNHLIRGVFLQCFFGFIALAISYYLCWQWAQSAGHVTQVVHLPCQQGDEVPNLKETISDLQQWKQSTEQLIRTTKKDLESALNLKIIKAIATYEADKTGLFDYAAEYAGGAVVAWPDTEPYITNKTVTIMKLLTFHLTSNPQVILQPITLPGHCFSFHGNKGRVIIRLAKPIKVRAVTLEHSSLILATEDATSAPKDFEVYGFNGLEGRDDSVFLGRFQFQVPGLFLQTFPVRFEVPQEKAFIELRILSNYGRKEFTCVYRFRVHAFF